MPKRKNFRASTDKITGDAAKPRTKQTKSEDDVHTLKLNSDFAKKYDERKRHEILSNLDQQTRLQLENSSDADESSDEDVEEDEFGELLTKKVDAQISRTLRALLRKDPAIYDKKTIFFEGSRNDIDNEEEGEDADSDVDSGDEPVAGWDTIAKAAEAETPKMTIKDYVRETLLKEGELPDSDDERITRRRHVEEENEEVARSKTILRDDGESENSNDDSDDDSSISSDGDDSSSSEDDSETESEAGNSSKETTENVVNRKEVGNGKKQDNSKNKDGLEDVDNGMTGDNEDDDDFFTVKKKTPQELEKEERDFDAWTRDLAKKKATASTDERHLHSYLEKESAEEKEQFLRNFVLNNGWLDNDGNSYGIERDIHGVANDDNEEDLEGNEEFNDKVDAFEAQYNFRFEDPDGTQMKSHARETLSSLRRPDERRKKAREAKKARKEKEKLLKTEEIKQLKNVKKREIQSRLLALQEAAGEGVDLTGIDLDGDFDPEAFSAQMESKFGEEYYNNEDAEFDPEKTEPNAEEVVGEHVDPETKQAVQGLMEEYYNLDYEDIVGGQPVRFKYKKVDGEDFGMSAEEILMADDRELNQRASLKYLAPYRDRQEVKRRAKTARWKAKYKTGKKAVDRENEAREGRGQKRRQNFDEDSTIGVGSSATTGNNEGENKSRKRAKRRHGKKREDEVASAQIPEPDKKLKKKKSVVGGMSAKRRAAYNLE